MATRRLRKPARQRFGEKVREKRKLAGLSQEAFADVCGLHRTYIGAVERGEQNISINNMEVIAHALHCSICELLCKEES